MNSILSMALYAGAGVFALILTFVILSWRRVVPPNDVHIVQARKKITSYGHGHPKNVYYEWPSWLPLLGVKTTELTVSIFSVNLHEYAAYDKGRVPFRVDVAAFFRISNADIAAQRVADQSDLLGQLENVLQGACRKIMASHDIEQILEGRAQFGQDFTQEVEQNLTEWGVLPVKQIEFMDIRDEPNGTVIKNIMEKKKSLIDMQSRVEVANNKRQAEIAEVEATQQVELRKQEAVQMVGQRTAEAEREVGIAQELAQQAIKDQQKTTKEREMAVQRVQEVRGAEITREVQVVQADQERQVFVIKAEAEKQNTILVAEGNLEASKLNAAGVKIEGEAAGAAKLAVDRVPVDLQITLAQEIGGNEGYQDYLIRTAQVGAAKEIGVANAAALEKAEIKVLANSGSASAGIESVGEVLTSKGGSALGMMMEGFSATEVGGAIVRRLTGDDKPAGKAA